VFHKFLAIFSLLALCAGKAQAEGQSPCLPELADERLELRCLATALKTGNATAPLLFRTDYLLGSGLIDHIQKMTIAAITMADMKAWAQRS